VGFRHQGEDKWPSHGGDADTGNPTQAQPGGSAWAPTIKMAPAQAGPAVDRQWRNSLRVSAPPTSKTSFIQGSATHDVADANSDHPAVATCIAILRLQGGAPPRALGINRKKKKNTQRRFSPCMRFRSQNDIRYRIGYESYWKLNKRCQTA